MSTTPVHRDERTTSIENASYRWGYLLLSFGLLLVVAYRSLVRQESPWDLLGLVIVGGLVSSAHQGFHRVLTRRWAVMTAATIAVALLLAAATAMWR